MDSLESDTSSGHRNYHKRRHTKHKSRHKRSKHHKKNKKSSSNLKSYSKSSSRTSRSKSRSKSTHRRSRSKRLHKIKYADSKDKHKSRRHKDKSEEKRNKYSEEQSQHEEIPNFDILLLVDEKDSDMISKPMLKSLCKKFDLSDWYIDNTISIPDINGHIVRICSESLTYKRRAVESIIKYKTDSNTIILVPEGLVSIII